MALSAREEAILSSLGPNSGYVRDMYERYRRDPSLVGSAWTEYFQHLLNGNGAGAATVAVVPEPQALGGGISDSTSAELQSRASQLISAYRSRGHLIAKINPLQNARMPRASADDLDPGYYNFNESELNHQVFCDVAGFQHLVLSELIDVLGRVYAGSIGFEFMHIQSAEERRWLKERIEDRFDDRGHVLTDETCKRVLGHLIVAETFEEELHKRFVGQKRFGLQGAETIMSMLYSIITKGADLGVAEAVIGMAHRGRLNVLANIIGKPLEDILSEFQDLSISSMVGAGDVKYHLGYSGKSTNSNGKSTVVSLAPNPSHLEFVNPVVEGIVRAKQDFEYGHARDKVAPILIHGDAAFIGQGVVWETLNLSGVDAYATGGTVHLIINNQVGFTTYPDESRSTPYCTDIAMAVQAPVFHINSEDVEAACWASQVALEYRQRFGRDVVLDLYCYRKYGHNEADEPSFTQPVMYQEIKAKRKLSTIYAEKLCREGVMTEDEVAAIAREYAAGMDSAQKSRPEASAEVCDTLGRIRGRVDSTGVEHATLERITQTMLEFPEDFTPHPKLVAIFKRRADALAQGKGIDWGYAEALALGSLLLERVPVRLTGQDSRRGTFGHRHLGIDDHKTGERYTPFSVLAEEGQTQLALYNSTLSEAAVVGFEFGFSCEAQQGLVMWEAQFGDFANGAQVLIDQFIAASEAKWNQLSGLVLLLPHGFEGMGPEHSSARLERYLQLCSEGNMSVCYPSNAAQYFHMLRRQGVSPIKRPLIVMTPKSLLRYPGASVDLAALESGSFAPVLEETNGAGSKHLLFMSGKIYHDLVAGLSEEERANANLIRVEELYPFPAHEVRQILERAEYKSVQWVQEEPRNNGAWLYIEHAFITELDTPISYIGRPSSPSVAGGSPKRHSYEQQSIVEEVRGLISPD